MDYSKLAKRQPVSTFYKSIEDLIKGEFPLISEEYYKDGKFDASKFIKDFDGIDILTFISRAGFTDSAMGWHYVESLNFSFDSE